MTQQSYRESFIAAHLPMLVEQSNLGVFLLQTERVLYANGYMTDLFGYSQEEIAVMKPQDLVFPDDRPFFMDKIGKRLQGKKNTGRNFLRGLRKDGSVFYYEAKSISVLYEGVPSLVGTLQDVTHTIQADEMIRDNDLRYQRLIKYLPEMIIVHDGDKIYYANNAGVRLLGAADQDQLLTCSYLSLIHEDFHALVKERIQIMLRSDEPLDFIRGRLVGLDGRELDVEMSGIRIHHFQGQPFVIQSVYRDLTERKKEEEAIIRSEKLSVVGQMAAGIAHEIRNPLTSLKGFTQFMKMRSNQYEEYYDIMLTELDRINTIVQEFMALAKPQTRQFSLHNIVHTINSVVTLLDTQAIINNVQMIVDFADSIPLVYCDENQLKQVFINLIKNAVEAMPHGGNLRISVVDGKTGNLKVQITDEGVGIAKEELDRLGGPFFSTKSTGTGLGLMICFRIIEEHRGHMSFDSKLGTGTTVTIELPVEGR